MTNLICPVCHEEFEPSPFARNQKYCSEVCRLEVKRRKAREKYRARKKTYPSLVCPRCGKGKMKLDFDPLVRFEALGKAWENFVCNKCGWKQTFKINAKSTSQKI